MKFPFNSWTVKHKKMELRKSAFLSERELLNLLNQIEGGYKKPSDPLFSEGEKLQKPFVKKGVISIDEEGLHVRDTIACNVPGCRQVLDTVFAYQSHYNALHRYNCSECKKSLPSPHLLDLHLSEQHDSFFAVQAERKPMFSCFLEECKHKSANAEERKDHCIRTHKFPHNFRFDKPLKKSAVNDDSEMLVEEAKGEKVKNPQSPKGPKHFTFGSSQSKVFRDKSYARALARKPSADDEKMDTSALEDKQTVSDLLDSLID